MDPTNPLSEDFADLSVRDQQPSLTRVSRERDQFIDDDHKGLDEELMETFGFFREHNANPNWPGLLSNITLGDERLVTLSLQEAGKLLSSQPCIIKVLQEAWKNNSFKAVRQLSQFFVAMQPLFESLIIIEGVLWPVVREARRWFSLLF